jgi:hypothetical protein
LLRTGPGPTSTPSAASGVLPGNAGVDIEVNPTLLANIVMAWNTHRLQIAIDRCTERGSISTVTSLIGGPTPTLLWPSGKSLSTAAERLNNRSEFFAQLHARRVARLMTATMIETAAAITAAITAGPMRVVQSTCTLTPSLSPRAASAKCIR